MQAIASDPDAKYYERRAIELIQEAREDITREEYHNRLIMATRLLTLARAVTDEPI